jgi:hypothetical protein
VTDVADAVLRLVNACPGFKDAWEEHLDWWEGEPAGEYNDLGALAEWVADQLAARDFDCFPRLFGEVEALLVPAKRELRELLVVGLLEDTQNVATNRKIDPDLVLPFLGPESRKAWFELIRLWHGPDGSGWPGQKHDG